MHWEPTESRTKVLIFDEILSIVSRNNKKEHCLVYHVQKGTRQVGRGASVLPFI